MCLNYKRITLPLLVVDWLVQTTFQFPPLFVLPYMNASLSEFEVFELWVWVPNDSRRLFICSNQQRGLVESLPYSNFEAVMPRFRLTFVPRGNLPCVVC